jgi:nitrate/TMAO reductase-like tetraheme cytochrome c subunit
VTASVILAVLVGGFAIDFSLEATTTDEFCVSCHEMRDNISGADEERLHLAGSGELHGRCADCHLPKPFLPRLKRKLRTSAEIYHHLLGTLDSPESFEARRLQMAQRVWAEMNHNDSVECRWCHDDLHAIQAGESAVAREYHERADSNGIGCIDCHKGIAHRMPSPPSSRRQAFDPERCFACHTRENVLATPKTSHAKVAGLTSAEAREECAKCHGDGDDHVEFPIRGERVRFDAPASATPIEQEDACIDCHAADENARWRLATHGFSDTTCVSCHSIHRPGDGPLLRSLREPLCADSCHLAIASNGGDSEPTTREARTCTACHDPHSRGGVERCMICHPQGPGDLAEETPEARTFHLRGQAEGILCDQCHKGMLHRIPHAQLSKL